MFTLRKTVFALSAVVLLAGTAHAAPAWIKGSPDEEIKTLADIQPGLGTIMIEYSRRFGAMYYAAKGGNWGMAAYQEKEMPEIQEVGEKTRPKFAGGLKSFEQTHLTKLADAIKAKDWKKFEPAFHEAEKGCNECHEAMGYGFIKYEMPRSSPSPTSNRP
jgi:hypothetical protein